MRYNYRYFFFLKSQLLLFKTTQQTQSLLLFVKHIFNLPYWHSDTLKRPFGAHGGPAGQKHIFSGWRSTEANTSKFGVNRYPGTPRLVSTSFSNSSGSRRHKSFSYTYNVVFLVMCGGKMEPSVPFSRLHSSLSQCGKCVRPLYRSIIPNFVISSTPENTVTRS